MKALLIVGILLIVVGVTLGTDNSRPMTNVSETGVKVVSYSVLIGFILIIISGIMYLRK